MLIVRRRSNYNFSSDGLGINYSDDESDDDMMWMKLTGDKL